MSHVPYLDRDEADPSLAATYDAVASQVGIVLNLFKAMAHSPEALKGFLKLDAALRHGVIELDPKLKELAYLAVSMRNGCDYCRHYHHGFGRKAGLTERQVIDLDDVAGSDAYDDLQRDVIQFAEQVTTRVRPEPSLMERLKARLSNRALVELILTIALANFTNRVNEALGVELP
jgi:uncharacterized peroxidase-related enzyme